MNSTNDFFVPVMKDTTHAQFKIELMVGLPDADLAAIDQLAARCISFHANTSCDQAITGFIIHSDGKSFTPQSALPKLDDPDHPLASVFSLIKKHALEERGMIVEIHSL